MKQNRHFLLQTYYSISILWIVFIGIMNIIQLHVVTVLLCLAFSFLSVYSGPHQLLTWRLV